MTPASSSSWMDWPECAIVFWMESFYIILWGWVAGLVPVSVAFALVPVVPRFVGFFAEQATLRSRIAYKLALNEVTELRERVRGASKAALAAHADGDEKDQERINRWEHRQLQAITLSPFLGPPLAALGYVAVSLLASAATVILLVLMGVLLVNGSLEIPAGSALAAEVCAGGVQDGCLNPLLTLPGVGDISVSVIDAGVPVGWALYGALFVLIWFGYLRQGLKDEDPQVRRHTIRFSVIYTAVATILLWLPSSLLICWAFGGLFGAVAKALTKSRTHALIGELKPVMSGRAVSLFKSSFFEVT